MCGITGYWQPSTGEKEELSDRIRKMTYTLRHRGPDDWGVWVDPSAGLALGHQRLSILDLSAKGHQPMVSRSGRYVVTYNGEVYNFLQLRHELEESGINFVSTTDTEVILEAISKWGPERAFQKFIGMFAFALWDKKEKILYLVRDRIGIKPLYYGQNNGIFFFTSELKALRVHPNFKPDIDRRTISLFLRFNHVPAPYCIYEGMKKLIPGHYVIVREGKESSIHSYWDVHEVIRSGIENPLRLGEKEIADELEKLLLDAVNIRMIADVPLGAFLSGGIDSSTVVALMQSQSTRKVKTYTIGFLEKEFNEAAYAREVARHLGTDHTELYVSPEEAREVIPNLPEIYDEPFADYSQIPTFFICQLARRYVTVVLSGDGGDELFGGYNRYVNTPTIWNVIKFIPSFSRPHFGHLIRLLPIEKWNSIQSMIRFIFPRQQGRVVDGDKVSRFIECLESKDFMTLYSMIISHWGYPDEVVKDGKEPLTFYHRGNGTLKLLDYYQKLMFADLLTYLPDDILTKVDRASMALSLEVRVPILDHRVVEFSWKIPTEMKIKKRDWKQILRKVLYRYVPPQLVEREKTGFSLPIDTWLRDPLREWAEELLNENRLKEEGFFHPLFVRKSWAEHLSGERNLGFKLWNVLMFQSWLDRWFR